MFECVRSEVHVTTERLEYKGVVGWEGEVELVLEFVPAVLPIIVILVMG